MNADDDLCITFVASFPSLLKVLLLRLVLLMEATKFYGG